MHTHADKPSENKSKTEQKNNSKSTFQFVDNRQKAVAQKELQEIVNDSPQVNQMKAYQEMADNRPKAKQTALLQSMINSGSPSAIQKQGVEEEEPIQQKKEKSVPQFADGVLNQPPQNTYIQKKENNTGIHDTLKTGIEDLSNMSLDDVKVHYNSDKPSQLQGTDIHLASGQEKHLPHEAWHVMQQKQGRIKPTTQLKSNVNYNAGLNKLSDTAGNTLIQSRGAIIQRKNLETANLADRLGLVYDNRTMPTMGEFPFQGRVYDAAQWEARDRTHAMETHTNELAIVGSVIRGWGTESKDIQSPKSTEIYNRDEKKPDEKKLDPFVHKIDAWYGDEKNRQILTTYTQHTSDLDGYIIKIEDGKAAAPHVGNMTYGKQKDDGGIKYSSQHGQHKSAHLVESGTKSKDAFDATTKVIAEGARYQCIANYPGSCKNSTVFAASIGKDVYQLIRWDQLIIAWKGIFDGDYNIPNGVVAEKIRRSGGTMKMKNKSIELTEANAKNLPADCYMLEHGVLWSQLEQEPAWESWQMMVERAINRALERKEIEPNDINQQITDIPPASEKDTPSQRIQIKLWCEPEQGWSTMIDIITTSKHADEPHETIEEEIYRILSEWKIDYNISDELTIRDGLIQ